MGDKNDRRNDDEMFTIRASAPDKLNFFLRILGAKGTVATIICVTILLGMYIFLNHNPSGASFVTVINGNGNGDNNSGNTYSDHSTIASEQPRETDRLTEGAPPMESNPPTETGQTNGCDEIRYRVVPCEGLWLRMSPSTASDILKLFPCNSEVISEGCVDERGWLPVRVKLPCGDYRHGYVFAAYIDPIF